MGHVTIGLADQDGIHFNNSDEWQLPLSVLETVKRPSNHILQKNPDDSLEGMRYVVSPEPSTLRPIRSWTVTIEKWECKTMADISAQDILFVRLLNAPGDKTYSYDDLVSDIVIHGTRRKVENIVAFNVVMAAGIFINKIDAGRVPNVDKIMRTYDLLGN